MVKANGASKKKGASAAVVGKENAPAANGNGKSTASDAAKFKVPALPSVDRYAELENKKSAFSTLSAEAKVRAAAAPPIKEGAVPVGMRRSDAKNRARYSDGIAAEPVSRHRNGDGKKGQDGIVAIPSPAKKKEKSIKEMKAELRKKNGGPKKADKAPEQPQAGKGPEKRKRYEDEEEAAEEPVFMLKNLKNMQKLLNASMEQEIRENKKSKRARKTTPSDSEEDDGEEVQHNGNGAVHPLALVPTFKRVDTPHPVAKKSRLASGVTVEKPNFDVEEIPYTVEEPSEDDDSSRGRRRGRLTKKKLFSSQDFAAFEREMTAQGDAYDEDEDVDFESVDEDEELTDEEFEEVDTDEMSGEEMEDEEVDIDDEDEEELVSSDLDEEDAAIHPDDILRTITFDDDEEESDEDEDGVEEMDDDDEEEEEGSEMGEEMHDHNGCCDDSDCEEDGSELDGEDEEEGFTSDSSHVSDESYGEAFVDEGKSVTLSREVTAAGVNGKKKKKAGKGGAAAAAAAGPAIDFTAFPFKDVDSAVSAAKALDWLLSPCDAQTFFDDFFQSTSLVVRRNDPAYYGNLFSTGAMTALLRESCLEYGVNVNVALYAGGVRTTHNGTGRAYPLAIGDAIRAGCSVQLTNPQAYAAPVWYLCDALQEVFHCFVGANTYLTPAGASGFAPHWDEIDAFLLQVEGRKYWRVWAPETADDELPLESSGNFTEDDMAGRKPAFEGWIEQGDLLYIPRGFIHQARTDAKVHSLHVTVSAGRQWTFANLLQKLLPSAMEAFTDNRSKLRRQLPPGLLDMTGVAELPDDYPLQEAGESKLHAALDRHMSVFRSFVGGLRESGVDLMAREFMPTALPPGRGGEEKQLSAWGNDGADLFEEKGASRITPASEVRFIRRHGQRLLFESPEAPFVAHRMANARTYEGAPERTFPLTNEEEPVFADLLSAYPEWTTVATLKMKKKAKIAFLTKLFNHGLIMVRSA